MNVKLYCIVNWRGEVMLGNRFFAPIDSEFFRDNPPSVWLTQEAASEALKDLISEADRDNDTDSRSGYDVFLDPETKVIELTESVKFTS